MAHVTLARKYRPQTFEDLIGQPHVTATLTRALEQQRIGQAYLFTGQRGVGKTSAARILAKCLNCADGPTPRPCNRCDSCAHITQGSSLDVLEIDGASNRGIDEVRSLRETIPFAPTSGSFRVYIIDEVHMLTTEAFNALLKTLEEPPAHVKFIFATTAVNKVPATILSRCQRFDFKRVEGPVMVKALAQVAQVEKMQVSEAALYAIARASEGSLRDAEVVLEQLSSFVKGRIEESHVTELLGAVESDTLWLWVQAIFDRDASKALEILATELERGKTAPQLLTDVLRHLRNLLIVRSASAAPSREALLARLVDEPPDRLARLEEQASHVNSQELLLFLQVLTSVYESVRRSPMSQTMLELAVIKLSMREEWCSLDEISQRLERLASGSSPISTVPGSIPQRGSDERLRNQPSSATIATSRPPSAPPAPPSIAAPASLNRTAQADGGTVLEPSADEPKTNTSPELLEAWSAFLERLGAQKMSLAAYLMEARPVAFDAGTLTVGLPGFALHQEVASGTENRRLIERLLSEVLKAPVTVQYTTLTAPVERLAPAKAVPVVDATTPPIVQDIVNLFNATIMDQPKPT